MMSAGIHTANDRATITEWQPMPERLDSRYGYVLLVTPQDTVGTLHRIDIQHGWAAASLALKITEWRKQLNYGKDIATEVEVAFETRNPPPTWASLIRDARDLDDLRLIWSRAKELGQLTDELKAAATARSGELGG